MIRRFSAEHDDIVNAAGQLRRAAERKDVPAVQDAAHRLGHLLHPHTAGEERGLFAELRRDPEFTIHVDALHAEHTELDRRLDAITAGDLTAVPAFVDLLRRHIDREENGLFPAAAIALDGQTWERVVERTDGGAPVGAQAG